MAALDEAIFFILMASFFAVTLCEKKEELRLKVLYPIYGKNNKVFDCYTCSQTCKCKSNDCNSCIKVRNKKPVTYNYNNYEQVEDTEKCIQNYANLTYDNLKNTCYQNVKFYYDDKYRYKPCFVVV